ncbi:MAG: GDSL-type esterase/lipase family protein [Phycisphaerae bacterium]
MFRLTAALGGIVISLSLLEAGARLIAPDPPDAPLFSAAAERASAHRDPVQMADPYLFWRNQPNADLIHKGVRIRTNRFGMRDDPITRRKPYGVFRILSLGESTAFGATVAQDATYANQLEACLNRRGDGVQYQVLNAGVSGYSIVQSCEYLRRDGLGFDPDIVMIYQGFNDFLPTAHVAQRIERIPEGAKGITDLDFLNALNSRWNVRLNSWMITHSVAYRWVEHRLNPLTESDVEAARKLARTAVAPRVPAPDRLSTLRRFHEMTRREGVTLIVLVPAYRWYVAHCRLLLDFCRSEDVHCIDLELAVKRAGAERATLFADAVHPVSRLHGLFAEQICEHIQTNILAETNR